jgi:hypothetical protein
MHGRSSACTRSMQEMIDDASWVEIDGHPCLGEEGVELGLRARVGSIHSEGGRGGPQAEDIRRR